MKKYIVISVISVGAALVQFLLIQFGSPRCEGFSCIGVAGFLILFYGVLPLVVIPIIVGTLNFVHSKENKLKQALISAGICFLVMALFLGLRYVLGQVQVQNDIVAGQRAEAEAKIIEANSPFHLPLLDSRRPITIANQLTSSIVVSAKVPFKVVAYVREEEIVIDYIDKSEYLAADIIVFPGIQDKMSYAAKGKLLPTQKISEDGRRIFEGTLLVEDTLGATEGDLSVGGNSGWDKMRVTLK